MKRRGSIFAIGDIHGCADELDELLAELPLDAHSTLVFLGDYIDRGPESRRVVDRILALKEEHAVVCLRGNHEDLFAQFLEDPTSPGAGLFIYSGGSATLASYADENGEYSIPEAHLAFFDNLAFSHSTAAFFFVHAGVPEIPLEELDVVDHGPTMLWTRNSFLESDYLWSRIVVHGHSPVDAVEITANRINLDTGCVYGGRLSAIQLPELRIFGVRRKTPAERIVLRDQRSRRRAVRFRGTVPVAVQHRGLEIHFETADYSELGMFIRALDASATPIFRVGDVVQGEVRTDPSNPVPFRGRVTRVVQQDGIWYGLEILP
ncbi:MAG: metallophosphoesterase [Deltaproteobacteria bacterium]|nr:metallophosphoesterase [Deltaproteobacteria bacterium]